jgi:hypothetical protein
MGKWLLQHIIQEIKRLGSNVFLVENVDGFLFRDDVITGLKEHDILVCHGSSVQQRVQFELRNNHSLLLLLSKDNSQYLEDIRQKAVLFEFSLEKLLSGYHIPTIIHLRLEVLDKLFEKKQFVALSKSETENEIKVVENSIAEHLPTQYDPTGFMTSLDKELLSVDISWLTVSRIISMAIIESIGTQQFEQVLEGINKANEFFQIEIQKNYQQTKTSSAIKKPKIVSKILDYINFNFRERKIALIVIDGFAFWQYELLKNKLSNIRNEDVIYSWIPSITQLSRQAIFRGQIPHVDYKQGPVNEKKLWFEYWEAKGLNKFEIKYAHEKIELANLKSITKYAIVFKDLDEKMHSSTDYIDLLNLTQNWIERSKVISVIDKLSMEGFRVFLTTDHGNIQAKGWRGLNGREKLGTNQSGSRSERHLEYSEKWLSDEFLSKNPELGDSIVSEGQSIYFKDDFSFSNKETLVTHGGSHILEVLIPFIELGND